MNAIINSVATTKKVEMPGKYHQWWNMYLPGFQPEQYNGYTINKIRKNNADSWKNYANA